MRHLLLKWFMACAFSLSACSDSTAPKPISLAGPWTIAAPELSASITLRDSLFGLADTLSRWRSVGDTIIVQGMAIGSATATSNGQAWSSTCGAMLYRSWAVQTFQPDTSYVLRVQCVGGTNGQYEFDSYVTRSSPFSIPVTGGAAYLAFLEVPNRSLVPDRNATLMRH